MTAATEAKPKPKVICDNAECGRECTEQFDHRIFHHIKDGKKHKRYYCCSCLDAMQRVQQWHPRKLKPVAVLNLAQAEERIEELAVPGQKIPAKVGEALAKGKSIKAGAFTFCKPGAHGKPLPKAKEVAP